MCIRDRAFDSPRKRHHIFRSTAAAVNAVSDLEQIRPGHLTVDGETADDIRIRALLGGTDGGFRQQAAIMHLSLIHIFLP